MPSDSVAGFLDRAQASRVLFPEQVEQLIRQPDIPHSDLSSLCLYLLSRGVLTKFQADALREGRGHDLSFAGYPLLDVIGPCRGGTAYRALHPSLRTPLILRRFDPGAFAPTDNPDAVINRARTFGLIQHPNILPLLDAGVYQEQAYAVTEQLPDAADLGTMLAEVGGAMPGFLAAEYGVAIASALRAIHERGGWHGEVRPGLLIVSPLVTKSGSDGRSRRRPAPNAIVRLTNTGLIPVQPAASIATPEPDVLPYLPPERIDASRYEARGDIYGLGASLYLLLAGRPPFIGEATELLDKIRSAEPPPLASLRPDVPAELCAFIMTMLAKQSEDRPKTAFDVCEALAPFCRPGTLPAVPQPAVPQPLPVAVNVPHAVPAPEAAPAPEPEPDGWGVDTNAFAVAQAASRADTTQKRRRQLTDADKSRSRMWIALGLCLHLTAVGLLVAWFLGAFSSSPVPSTEPTIEKKPNSPPKKPRTKNKKTNPDREPD